MTQTILHLVDDLTPGGITRFLDHLETLPGLQGAWKQQRLSIGRGRWSAPNLQADVIVSHLSISWRNLPMFLALRAKHPTTPILHVEHTYTAMFMAQEVRNPLRFKTLLRTVFAMFDHVVAVSKAQHAWLVDADLVRDGRHSVINPSTDITPFLAIGPDSATANKIGVVSRLDDPKGIDVLIRAFRAAAPDHLSLSIFGTGDALPKLTAIAAGDPRILFEGHTDPAQAIASCDVIAIPSRRESFGLVALEARAAGRMVLVSGADGLADHVQDGAVLVGSEVSDWLNALNRLADMHDTSRLQVARSRAVETAQNSAQNWQSLFERFATVSQLQLAS